MPLKKTFSKSKDICKVTFNFPANDAKKVCVAGDFNEWNPSSLPMKKSKNMFTATIELDANKDYQFRYLIDDERWENDQEADSFVQGPFPDCENCIISTRG